MKHLRELQGKHLGADAYVIGSGQTLEHYDPAVFDGCLTIGVNQGWANHLDSVDYMVTKYHGNVEWWQSGRVGDLIVTRGIRGHLRDFIDESPEYYVVEHNDNPVEAFTTDDWPDDEHALVASHSSITTALHLAAYMGARRIFTVAADCGTLDGHMTVTGHDRRQTTLNTLKSFDVQNSIVKAELEKRYDTTVIGLSPFPTPNMTGHVFESWAGRLDAS